MDRRAPNPSAWTVNDLYVAHFALSQITEGEFRFFERVNRAGPGIAHAAVDTLDLKNESWTAVLDGEVMRLRAYADGILLELDLVPTKAPIIHGNGGISQKADGVGQASHYYSMTRLETTGLVSIDGRAVGVSGQSWMDHEFGTNQLGPEQIGWDWFSLQFDNGEELMLYQMRQNDGSVDPNSSGTVANADGGTEHLEWDAYAITAAREWSSPQSGATYPLEWTLALPGLDADLRVIPLLDAQELFTVRSTGIAYWEGAVRVEGTWRGQPVSGRGYVELTGYGERYRPAI
jgi:predicted secreted hydrolase